MKTSWRNHYKHKLVKRMIGADGVLSVYNLWAFAAENKTDGDLTGMTDLAIAVAADWEGEPSEFIETLTEVKLLDGEFCAYKLHDWADHNPYVASHVERSNKAKRAGEASGIVRKQKANELNRTQPDISRTPSPDPFPDPSPSPSPSPKKKKDAAVRHEKPEILEAGDSVFSSIQDHYVRVFPGRKAQTETKAVKRLVGALLAKGYGAIDLMTAIDGCSRSEWHLMHGHTSLAFICKDAARLDSFISKTLPTVTSDDKIILEARERDDRAREARERGELFEMANPFAICVSKPSPERGRLEEVSPAVRGETSGIPAGDIRGSGESSDGEVSGLVPHPPPIVGDSEGS